MQITAEPGYELTHSDDEAGYVPALCHKEQRWLEALFCSLCSGVGMGAEISQEVEGDHLK